MSIIKELTQEQLRKLAGKSIKVCLKDELEPFYLKVEGYAKNGSSFHGVDQEGQSRMVRTSAIEWVAQ